MDTDKISFWLAIRTPVRSEPGLFGPYTRAEAVAYREHLLHASPALAEVGQVIEADCRLQAEWMFRASRIIDAIAAS